MLTLNQIVKKLREIRQAHPQLNSFEFGDFDEIGSSEAYVYPLLACDFLPGSITRQIVTTKMIILVCDRVRDDNSNLLEVLSNTHKVCLDVFAQLYEYFEDNQVELSREAVISDFNRRFDDSVAGHQLEITINQFYSKDTCQVPTIPDFQYLLLDADDEFLLLENGQKLIL